MFFRSKRGRRDPRFLPIRDYEDPIQLDEARLDAWAMALGEQRRPSYRSRRRPHRGLLPDVDFTRAVPVERPGLLKRLLLWLAGKRGGPAEKAGERVEPVLALGETRRKPYVWLVEPDDSASDEMSEETGFGARAAEYNGSRAA